MTELNARSPSAPMTDISRLLPAVIMIFLLWYFQ